MNEFLTRSNGMHLNFFCSKQVTLEQCVNNFEYFFFLTQSFNLIGKLVGVHSVHGVNRAGYMICRYMIEEMGIPPQRAISGNDIKFKC